METKSLGEMRRCDLKGHGQDWTTESRGSSNRGASATELSALDEAAASIGRRVSCPDCAGVRRGARTTSWRGGCERRRGPWQNGEASSTWDGWRGCTTNRASGRHALSADEAVEAVIVKTLETTPPGETHWSTRSWRRRRASVTRWSAASGGRSACNRTHRVVQTVARPATRREDPRCRRALHAPAGQRRRVLGR